MGYLVVRQDDNGNRTVMARFTDRAEADAMEAAFTARAHKQIYWVEVEPDPSPAATPTARDEP